MLAGNVACCWRSIASQRRACATVLLQRTVYHYVGHPRVDRAVRQNIKEIAASQVRYGFERIQVPLRREGWRDNHKRTYRITGGRAEFEE